MDLKFSGEAFEGALTAEVDVSDVGGLDLGPLLTSEKGKGDLGNVIHALRRCQKNNQLGEMVRENGTTQTPRSPPGHKTVKP